MATALLLQLGLGTLWMAKGLSDSITPTCSYIANSKATAEYQALSGCTTAVPLEQDDGPGTECGHWDEVCFQSELMTGSSTGSLPLSRVTAGSLEDLGYTVDYDKTDAFTASDLDDSCRCNNILEESSPATLRNERDKRGQASMYKFTDLFGGAKPLTTKRHPKKRRKISPEGRKAAIAYGKKYLRTEADRRANMTDTGDHIFVGDQFVIILYYEEGEVYGLDVWNDEPRRLL